MVIIEPINLRNREQRQVNQFTLHTNHKNGFYLISYHAQKKQCELYHYLKAQQSTSSHAIQYGQVNDQL